VALPAASAGEPRIVAAHPNPLAEADRGESVVLSGAGNLTFSDGEWTLRVPTDRTVALSAAPSATRYLTDHPVIEVALPELSNAGGVLSLYAEDRCVARVEYANAPEGELRRWRYDGSGDGG
jgi:hypothetical protein